MGWIWTDDDAGAGDTKAHSSFSSSGDASDFRISSSSSDDLCSTRKVVKTQCRSEEVEPGKFLRKCQKTEEIFKDCVGRPTELMQSNKEYTEEDVTGQMGKGSLSLDHAEDFNFPGLSRDIEALARSFLGTFDRVFDAAEEMKNGFFTVFGTPHIYDSDSSSAAKRESIPIDEYHPKEVLPESSKSDGDVDLSGLARDI
ncbi:hypothetical protein ACH5RR_005713 [Cinchona calisaya]|uniref:Mal d 1-associated protein n=1 Tax=Cinchona calisaya TaxID=153742 RepID=A0ABD3AM09_9GENT